MEARLAGLPPFDLGQRLLATAVLDAAALLIAVLVCVALALLERSRPRAATAVIETIRPLSMAVPTYVLGPLLLFIFAFSVRPPRSATGQLSLSDPRQFILPALTLAIGAVALTLAQMRSGMFSFARADGSRTASWAVIGLYLLGATISWTFVVETIFGWPGIGSAAFSYGLFFARAAKPA